MDERPEKRRTGGGEGTGTPMGKPAGKEPRLTRLWRFLRSVIVGLFATAADMATLTSLVQFAHVTPVHANVPSLLVGMAVQFIGVRKWVFHAEEGSVFNQAVRFAFAELGTLLLNAVVFHVLVTHTPIPYWLDRPIGTFAVYVGFSYHAWKRVFAHAQPEEEVAAQDDGPGGPARREQRSHGS